MKKVNIECILKLLLCLMFIMIYIEARTKHPELIYILLWTHTDMEAFGSLNPRRKSFSLINCEFQNCYITGGSNYFDDMTDYDVVLFNAVDTRIEYIDLPEIRTDNQLYLFASLESATIFPISESFNWFFNYTWTYKLKSDIFYPYFIVRNKHGEVIAPKEEVHWMNVTKMKSTKQAVKNRLKNKKKAAAWFVSNCLAHNERINYVHNLREALTSYDLEIDIYGSCGYNYCPKENMDKCLALVESDYYFYLAFENSLSEDYVTEKVLHALEYFSVPIVYGGANYTRFMPDGIYLNANEIGEEEMARRMNELIKDKEKYYNYFKWHRYYTYHDVSESADTDPFCKLCAFLNNMTIRHERRVYASITQWWNENKLKEMEDPVFHYKNADTIKKDYYMTRYNKKSPVTLSVMQNVGQLVDQLYNYFFDS